MADAFVDSIGVNTHLYFTDTAYGNFRGYETLLVGSGIRHIRDGNASPTVNNRGAYYYPLLRDLASHGIHTTLINDPRNDGQTAQQQVANLSTLGTGVVEAMEGPNEYDASGDANWPADLTSFQQQLYAGVKALRPAMTVIGPSVAAKSVVQLGNMGSWSDYGNMHPYSLWPPKPLAPMLDAEITGHQPMFSGRPMMATEFGYPTATQPPGAALSVTETVQAKYVLRAFLEATRRGVARMWDFQLLDGHSNAGDAEQNFGLLRNDLSKKPTYYALQNLIRLLSDPGPSFQTRSLAYDLAGPTGNVDQLLLQRRDSTFFLVLWLEVPSQSEDAAQSVTVNFAQSMAGIGVYLPMQSASPKATLSNVTSVHIGVPDEPVVLQVSPVGTNSTGAGGLSLISDRVSDVRPVVTHSISRITLPILGMAAQSNTSALVPARQAPRPTMLAPGLGICGIVIAIILVALATRRRLRRVKRTEN